MSLISTRSIIFKSALPRSAIFKARNALQGASSNLAFSSSSLPSPKIALVQRLRKDTDCSISKAKEALSVSAFNYEKALEWLQKDMEEAAAKKAEKVKGRNAVEGLVGVCNHAFGMHASLVEVNCETDFVAKSSQFCALVVQIANTTALFEQGTLHQNYSCILPISIESLSSKRLVDGDVEGTVEDGVRSVIGKLGENIEPRRGLVAHQNQEASLIFGAYAHAAGQLVPAGLGRLGSIVAIQSHSPSPIAMEKRKKVAEFARKVAQHISGFNPTSITSNGSGHAESALLEQSFLFGGGSVAQVLAGTDRGTRP